MSLRHGGNASATTTCRNLSLSIPSVETRSSWIVATVSVALMATSFRALWITAVALKPIAAELGGGRSAPSLASSLAWLGTSFGGLVMGRIAYRYGIRWTVMFGAVSMAIGLVISTLGAPWQLYVGHGLFMGVLGNAGLNAPLYVYVSRWFDRRRGSALALISSGSYLAGAVWPPIFERAIAAVGWRQTMLAYAVFEVALILPLALMFLRAPPDTPPTASGAADGGASPKVFGWPPNVVFVLLAFAAFLCCVTMSMPQAHLVALCSDLGISATHGAAMLSLLLGAGFLSRQVWGVISDRVGGLLTLLTSSFAQMIAMTGFLLTQDEAGLFTVAGAFGVGFSGLVPAYVLAIREYFPVSQASWRVPTLLLLSGSGMATGGWSAGVLYDHFGYYEPAFAAGVAANMLNFLVIATLVARARLTPGPPREQRAVGLAQAATERVSPHQIELSSRSAMLP
jgi:MFS family permease